MRVAVGLESLDQAEAAIERKGGDERAGGETRRAKRVRERRGLQVEPHAVVPGAMAGGIASGHAGSRAR